MQDCERCREKSETHFSLWSRFSAQCCVTITPHFTNVIHLFVQRIVNSVSERLDA